jgi:hypothetical protein
MNYLAVLNIGDFMCLNVRESLMDACKRWNVEFYEIKNNIYFQQDLCFNKILGIKSLLNERNDVRGVMYMDSDMLIRKDAPNPFDIFNDRSRIYVVKDYDNTRFDINSDQYKDVKEDVSTPWLRNVHKDLNWEFSEGDIINCTDWFFNAGLFLLYVPESIYEMNLFISHAPSYPTNSRYEQALWNYIIKTRRKSVFIPSTWNTISPDIEDNYMKSYIYHFTGVHCFTNGVKRRERTFDWRSLSKT